MPLIYLDKISSTNDYLKDLLGKEILQDNTFVVAAEQTAGRGQMGNSWISSKGSSISLSIYKKQLNIPLKDHFKIAMSVSLAVRKVFALFSEEVRVKWPNDILIKGKKVGGILIENTIQGNEITSTVIGIGLNVFKFSMPELTKATALSEHSKLAIKLDYLQEILMIQLDKSLSEMEHISYPSLKFSYESHLFGIGVLKTFSRSNQKSFQGFIRGVTSNGALIIENQEGLKEFFQFKEVSLKL
jgi:BirA family biotin operon repressor/biotin-[acetyl-CoA-carboxylase] ligase